MPSSSHSLSRSDARSLFPAVELERALPTAYIASPLTFDPATLAAVDAERHKVGQDPIMDPTSTRANSKETKHGNT
jgi:hypothetical protein